MNHRPPAGTTCFLLEPSATCWNHLPTAGIACRLLKTSVACWNRLPPAGTACHLLEPCPTGGLVWSSSYCSATSAMFFLRTPQVSCTRCSLVFHLLYFKALVVFKFHIISLWHFTVPTSLQYGSTVHTFFTLVRVTHYGTNSSVLHFRELPFDTSE
jgi:hypothetical protein